jgi:hypothetical protein
MEMIVCFSMFGVIAVFLWGLGLNELQEWVSTPLEEISSAGPPKKRGRGAGCGPEGYDLGERGSGAGIKSLQAFRT